MKNPSVTAQISKLARAHRALHEKSMCEIGLHSGQAQVLIVLWQEDGLSQAQIVRDLCVSPPTVNKIVGNLKRSGFVDTKRCPADKRLVRVHLTKTGIAMRSRVLRQEREIEKHLLAEFNEMEIATLPILLRRLEANLAMEIGERKGDKE